MDLDIKSITERFLRKVVQRENGCWEWTGYKNPNGYGQIRIGGRKGRAMLSHRVAWIILGRRAIPKGYGILHRCDNPACVNPDHLFVGNQVDNMSDSAHKGRHPRNKSKYLPTGKDHHFYNVGRKITRAQAMEILNDPRENYSEIARSYGIHPSLVSRIKARKIWK